MGLFGGGKSKGFISVEPSVRKPSDSGHLAAERMGWDTGDAQSTPHAVEPAYNAGREERLDITSLGGTGTTHITSGRIDQGATRVSDLLNNGITEAAARSTGILSALRGLDEDDLYDAADTLGELQTEAANASDAFDGVADSVLGAYRDSLETMTDEIENWREALDTDEYSRSAAVIAGNAEVSRFLAELTAALESCDSKGFRQRMAALERQAGQESVVIDRLCEAAEG